MIAEDGLAGRALGGEHGAPAGGGWNARERRDLGVDAAMTQRLDDDAALPFGVECRRSCAGRRSRRRCRSACRRACGDPGSAAERSPAGPAGLRARARRARRTARSVRRRRRQRCRRPGRRGATMSSMGVRASRTAPNRNSRLPEPPAMGDGMRAGDAPAGLCAHPGFDGGKGALTIGRIAHDAALADGVAAGLELRLDQRDQPAARHGQGQCGGQGLRHRDEADVGDDGADVSGNLGACQGACIATFQVRDTRVAGDARAELGMTDIDGINVCRTALQQNLGEAAGGGADIKRGPACGIETGIDRARPEA